MTLTTPTPATTTTAAAACLVAVKGAKVKLGLALVVVENRLGWHVAVDHDELAPARVPRQRVDAPLLQPVSEGVCV